MTDVHVLLNISDDLESFVVDHSLVVLSLILRSFIRETAFWCGRVLLELGNGVALFGDGVSLLQSRTDPDSSCERQLCELRLSRDGPTTVDFCHVSPGATSPTILDKLGCWACDSHLCFAPSKWKVLFLD